MSGYIYSARLTRDQAAAYALSSEAVSDRGPRNAANCSADDVGAELGSKRYRHEIDPSSKDESSQVRSQPNRGQSQTPAGTVISTAFSDCVQTGQPRAFEAKSFNAARGPYELESVVAYATSVKGAGTSYTPNC